MANTKRRNWVMDLLRPNAIPLESQVDEDGTVHVPLERLRTAIEVCGYAGDRPTLPITANVAFHKGTIMATNLDQYIVMPMPELAPLPSITVPRRLLREVLGKNGNGNDDIGLKVSDTPYSLHMNRGASHWSFYGTQVDEFPPCPQVKEYNPLTMRGNWMQILTEALSCAADEKSRPVLMSVYVAYYEQTFYAVAADGFRLFYWPLEADGFIPEGIPSKESALPVGMIPTGVVTTMNKMVSRLKDGGPGVFHWSTATDRQIDITLSTGARIVSQSVEGNFPNYVQFMLKHDVAAVFDSKAMLKAVKEASIVARDDSGILRFQGVRDGVQLTARAEETAAYETTIPAYRVREGWQWAGNSRYMADMVKGLQALEPSLPIEMGVDTPSLPGVFRPEGKGGRGIVIMPMSVQW